MSPLNIPEKWLALNTSMREEFTEYWGGDWGCDSETGTLRAVLLRRPGHEINHIHSADDWRWREIMAPMKARAQHDALAEFYRSRGVTVHYVEKMRKDRPNGMFMRDNILMTPDGAIVGRQALECRRGEERYAAEALAALGVPIIRTISGTGIFETACLTWVDAETVIMGTGNRANWEGYYQMEGALREAGVEYLYHIEIPYGYAHIDSIVSFVDKKTAIVDPLHVSWNILNALLERGITILEAPSPEETKNLALNVVAVAPGSIVMAAGNPVTKKFLEDNGIEVTELDMSEILKGWGSIHCMTAVLKRDPVGKLFEE